MADYSGTHMSHSPYFRAYGTCHPDGYCAADDWGEGIHSGTYDVVNAWLDAYNKKVQVSFASRPGPPIHLAKHPKGGVTVAREPTVKEKPVTILDAKTLAFISAMLETLNSFDGNAWPDLYVSVEVKTTSGDKIGAFTDEYGDWVFETAADGTQTPGRTGEA